MNTAIKASSLTHYDPNSAEARDCTGQPVGVHTLSSSPTNPRKSFPEASMAGMIESVKQHGVFTPILVRPWPTNYPWDGDMPLYEIVAGERRFRAAKAAGLRLIPALVRNLTDKQVIEIQLTENLQREDVHALDEAEGYEKLMTDHGYTADQIAEKVSKSRSYIFGRLKLLALDADSRRLFSGGLLNASTALLIARIPTPSLRAKAIKEITEKDYNGDAKSVRQAQRWIRDRYMLKLVDATFPTDDATLCGGACTECPKRTGNVQEVFDDIDSPDVCTDPDCFQAKKAAFMLLSIAKAKADGAQVITGSAAKKIAPHGIHDYSTIKDFTRLDDKCYEDSEKRTYRSILGDSVETVLVEDVAHQRLVPLVANTVLAERLKEAGIKSRAESADKREKEIKARLDLERAYRERLFSSLRAKVSQPTLPGVQTLPEAASSWILMRAAEQLFSRLYSDVQGKIAILWHADGKNLTERNKRFISDTLPRLSADDLWLLLVDLTTAGCTLVSEYSIDHEPKVLLDMATLFDIDPAQVRKDAISARKEEQKVGKSARTTVSAGISAGKSPPPPADDLGATQAARAGESLAPKSVECDPTAIAAQAGEAMRNDGRATLKAKFEEIIESKDKPTAAESPRSAIDVGELHVGDRVQIKMGLKTMNGQRRKCCGREGVVEALAAGYVHVRTAPGVNGLITNLKRNEVDRLPNATQSAPATVTKASRSQVRATAVKRQTAKGRKVINEKTVRHA